MVKPEEFKIGDVLFNKNYSLIYFIMNINKTTLYYDYYTTGGRIVKEGRRSLRSMEEAGFIKINYNIWKVLYD